MISTSAQILAELLQERVERIDHAAADAVFDGHQAVIDVAADDFFEDRRMIASAARNRRCCRNCMRGGGMGEGALGAEESDAQRLLQRERSAHQLAIDRLQTAIRQRALVELANLLEDLFLAIGR